MSEEPKSIWKKSRKGWRAVLVWLLVVIIAATIATLAIAGIMFATTPTPLFAWHEGAGALSRQIFAVAFGFFFAVLVVFALYKMVRWLFRWRNLKRTLFAIACFVTLIALFYSEEDWRGRHDWNQFKQKWEAKGEKFGWQSVVPAPVPDDENFAFSPVWIAAIKYFWLNDKPKRAEAWYGNRIYSQEVSNIFPLLPVSLSGLTGTNFSWSAAYSPNLPKVSGDWATARLADLTPWQAYYRGLGETNPASGIPITPQPQSPAQDVLLALSKFNPVFEQLRADSARPDSRFPIGYDNEDKAAILLPHLAVLKRYSQVLQLRTIAELRNGQSDKALADVKLALHLVNAIHTEPFLISHLVRIAMLQVTLQPIYEGLADHQWSDAQLAELESELGKFDFVADYQSAMRGEMGMHDGIFDHLRHHPDQLYDITEDSGYNRTPLPARIAVHLIPSGWFYQNQLYCDWPMVQFYLPVADPTQQTISPGKVKKAATVIGMQTRRLNPFNFMERLMLPSLVNAARKFAYGQASVDLARTAIALERYRLANGGYPQSLDALAPRFIAKVPRDVIGGGPLHYRLTDDGQFVLYSIGWNQTDDGGVVVFRNGSTPTVDISRGDWVWRYPRK